MSILTDLRWRRLRVPARTEARPEPPQRTRDGCRILAETWAFITWVLYAAFLHARATAGWRGRRAHYIQLLGFTSLVFNILVVQVFIAGLHSYAGVS
jgi:hypothetical protein